MIVVIETVGLIVVRLMTTLLVRMRKRSGKVIMIMMTMSRF